MAMGPALANELLVGGVSVTWEGGALPVSSPLHSQIARLCRCGPLVECPSINKEVLVRFQVRTHAHAHFLAWSPVGGTSEAANK